MLNFINESIATGSSTRRSMPEYFIDVADVYSAGESERIVAKAFSGGRRDAVILATKCHFRVEGEDPNRRGNSRRWLVQACEDSLRRLGTDWIDR